MKSALKLNGASVCVQSGTTTELNLADYFRVHKMKFKPVVFDTADETVKAFEAGRCDVLTSDQSQLYALRIKLAQPDSAIVLPEVISKEPLGPVVRQGDDEWFNIVRWTLFAMVDAEELGVTSANVDEMKDSKNPDVKRLLGADGDQARPGRRRRLGLQDRQAGRQLRRGLRAQRRHGQPAQDQPRPERPVERRAACSTRRRSARALAAARHGRAPRHVAPAHAIPVCPRPEGA